MRQQPQGFPTGDQSAVQGASMYTKRPITHDEAKAAAQRLINSFFGNREEGARARIPADPDKDDDLVICGYIEQQRAANAGSGITSGETAEQQEAVVPPPTETK